jgi:putative DNA primase/helicase
MNILSPNFSGVPTALRQCDQWIVWKAVEMTKSDGSKKTTKVPYHPMTGEKASSKKSSSWSSFDTVVEAYLFGEEFAGIGFVFSSEDDFVGIDLDSCFDEDGKLKTEAENTVLLLDSYTEVSPSGNGLHIICRGGLPGSGHCDHKKGREIYSERRFFTITGEVLQGKTEVKERDERVRHIYNDWFGPGSVKDFTSSSLDFDDKATISDLDSISVTDYLKELIRNGENMDDFLDVNGCPDRSLALFYVCREMVASNVNKETILTILTDSNHYLSQAAIERRGSTESAMDWVWKYTLSKLIAQREEEKSLFDDLIDSEEEGEAEIDETASDVPYVKSNFEKNAMLFLKNGTPLVRHQEQYYRYAGKHWKHYSEEQVERDVQFAVRGKGFTMAQINNSIKAVKRFSTKDDFEPSPTHIAFENGVLDLVGWDKGQVNFTLKPHSPSHKTMSYLSFDFDASAHCPLWLSFIEEVFEGDPERMLLLQQFMGYALVYDYRWQKMLVMSGESRSGKGTISTVIRHIIGSDAYVGTSLSSMSADFGLHALVTAKVAVIGDAKQAVRSNINRAHEVLLNITGNDYVPVKRKYASELTMRIPARVIMMANNVPRFADDADALFNRYLVLPFRVSFAGKEDVTLSDRLIAEGSGIFNWALRGLLNLAKAGKFVESEVGKQQSEEMRIYNNPLGAFCEKFVVSDPAEKVPCRELYESYVMFCNELNISPSSNIDFSRKVMKQLPWITQSRTGGEVRQKMYNGIKFDVEQFGWYVDNSFD